MDTKIQECRKKTRFITHYKRALSLLRNNYMDNTTTILSVAIANPNDPAESTEKKLVIAYSNGETDFMSYTEVLAQIDNLEQTNEQAQTQIDWRDIKISLLNTVITDCNTELGINSPS